MRSRRAHPGENPKIHIFAIRITNERIKLTSFLTISYITFNTTLEYNIYYFNSIETLLEPTYLKHGFRIQVSGLPPFMDKILDILT